MPWPSPELAWQFHFLRARLARDGRAALAEFRAAVRALQTARRSLSREELCGLYLTERLAVFDAATAHARRLADVTAAFEFVEEKRAQSLAAQLRRPLASPDGTPDSIRQLDRLRAEIRVRQGRLSGRIGSARRTTP